MLEEWTQNKISENFGIDRRELRRIFSDVGLEPVRIEGRNKYYRVLDVFEALKYGTEKLDLTQESAKHKQELARKIKRENDLEEGLLVPVDVAMDALIDIGDEMSKKLDALPMSIRKRCPSMPNREVEFMIKEIASCKNLISDIKI